MPGTTTTLPFVSVVDGDTIKVRTDQGNENLRILALDTEEAATIIGALAEKDVLFMRHHGVIVVGRDVADAYYHLYYLELAAKRQLLAMNSKQDLVDISEDIAQLVGRQFEDEREESAGLNFAALKRRLDREDRGYAD